MELKRTGAVTSEGGSGGPASCLAHCDCSYTSTFVALNYIKL